MISDSLGTDAGDARGVQEVGARVREAVDRQVHRCRGKGGTQQGANYSTPCRNLLKAKILCRGLLLWEGGGYVTALVRLGKASMLQVVNCCCYSG